MPLTNQEIEELLSAHTEIGKAVKVATVTASDLASGGSGTLDIDTSYNLPAKGTILYALFKTTEAFRQYQISTDISFGQGDGGSNYSFSSAFPISVPGSIVVTTDDPSNTETLTDNGDGTFTGDQGGSGTVNYLTGNAVLNFNSVVANGANIIFSDKSLISQVYVPQQTSGEVIGHGDGITTHFTGTLANPNGISLANSSYFIGTVGGDTLTDNNDGTWNDGGSLAGTINYKTGAFVLDFVNPPPVGVITADYRTLDITAVTASLGTDLSFPRDDIILAGDVFQLPADTAFFQSPGSQAIPVTYDFANIKNLKMEFIATGGDVATITFGSLDIYLITVVQP